MVESPSDLVNAWDNLRNTHPGLPSQLRLPQRDALFWLMQGKSVLLNIGTGPDLDVHGTNVSHRSIQGRGIS